MYLPPVVIVFSGLPPQVGPLLQVTTGRGFPDIKILASKSRRRSTFTKEVADSILGAPASEGWLTVVFAGFGLPFSAGLGTSSTLSDFGSGSGSVGMNSFSYYYYIKKMLLLYSCNYSS